VCGPWLFWKIDCYDLAGEFGAEDPSDAKRTLRVLTIMLAEEQPGSVSPVAGSSRIAAWLEAALAVKRSRCIRRMQT
jgi:hypothetical protein